MYGELRAGASPERGARSGDRYGGSRHPPSAQELVSRRQDGFKAHLAAEPDTGIITDCALTKAAGADNHEAAVGLELLVGEDESVRVLADSLTAQEISARHGWPTPTFSSAPSRLITRTSWPRPPCNSLTASATTREAALAPTNAAPTAFPASSERIEARVGGVPQIHSAPGALSRYLHPADTSWCNTR